MGPIMIFALLLVFPLLAWWPGRMPRLIRKAATCLALLPILVGFVFVSAMWIARPIQLVWLGGFLLVVLGTMILAGAYSMWPSAMPRRKRAIAALFFVGPLLGLFTLAEVVSFVRGGTVMGKVTFKGQPLPSGKVSLLSENGVVCSGEIRPDGNYTVFRVPPGRMKIAVATYSPPPPGPVPVPAPKYVAIPARYRDFERSNLLESVRRGGQRLDLELQP
jgi:hypothetical protein